LPLKQLINYEINYIRNIPFFTLETRLVTRVKSYHSQAIGVLEAMQKQPFHSRAGILNSVLDTVGLTPLVRSHRMFEGDAEFLLKLEQFNPNGSCKDRIALHMIEKAEAEGKIKPGWTLVEGSSGNTALGIAMVGAVKGYQVIITMPRKMSQEKFDLLRALGAEVIWCPTEAPHGHPDNYVDTAERLVRDNQNYFTLAQLDNPNNPEAHYNTTGPEIWEQTQGKIDYFITGIGTSGTICGTGRFLKEKNPAIQIVAIDPDGSAYSNSEPKSYFVEGVGYDYLPPIYTASVIDHIVQVNDQDSFAAVRELALKEGILAGGSCGCVIAGARQFFRTVDVTGKRVVMLLHDTGRNYLSKVFNDTWMQDNGFSL
jgi:cystathionine beta-synthase